MRALHGAQVASRRAIFERNPDWSASPLEGKGGKSHGDMRKWSAYGKTAEGVYWEVYLAGDGETKTRLYYRALSVELPQLELVITDKEDFDKFKDVLLPKIESMMNSTIGKMAARLASNFLAPLGLSLEDMLGFVKTAEEHPAGSRAFQAKYALLTRGRLPLQKLICPASEAILAGWDGRDFGLHWGTQGLQFHIKTGQRGSVELAEKMVELGRLLTAGAN